MKSTCSRHLTTTTNSEPVAYKVLGNLLGALGRFSFPCFAFDEWFMIYHSGQCRATKNEYRSLWRASYAQRQSLAKAAARCGIPERVLSDETVRKEVSGVIDLLLQQGVLLEYTEKIMHWSVDADAFCRSGMCFEEPPDTRHHPRYLLDCLRECQKESEVPIAELRRRWIPDNSEPEASESQACGMNANEDNRDSSAAPPEENHRLFYSGKVRLSCNRPLSGNDLVGTALGWISAVLQEMGDWLDSLQGEYEAVYASLGAEFAEQVTSLWRLAFRCIDQLSDLAIHKLKNMHRTVSKSVELQIGKCLAEFVEGYRKFICLIIQQTDSRADLRRYYNLKARTRTLEPFVGWIDSDLKGHEGGLTGLLGYLNNTFNYLGSTF